MNLGIGIHAGGAGLRAGVGQRDVLRRRPGGVNLQLIDARLRIRGLLDREAEPFRRHRHKPLDVLTRVNGRPQPIRLHGANLRQRLELGQLHVKGCQPFAPLRQVFLLRLCLGRLHLAFPVPHAFENGLDRVVIGLRDGVELVIVATGASNRQSQERAPRRADHVVEFIGALVGRQHRVGAFHQIIRPGDQKAGGGIFTERVTRELFDDETIIRLVLVERADHVIAVRPRGGPGWRAHRSP